MENGEKVKKRLLKNLFFKLKFPFPYSLYYSVQLIRILNLHLNYFLFEKSQDSYNPTTFFTSTILASMRAFIIRAHS